MKEEKVNPFEMARKQVDLRCQKNSYENSCPYAWDRTGSGGDKTERNLSLTTDPITPRMTYLGSSKL